MMFAFLRHYCIPEQIVNAIGVLYDNSKSRVYVDVQDDVLAPFLFIIIIDSRLGVLVHDT